MQNNWKKIWNKIAKSAKHYDLKDLMALNGHSSYTSKINIKEWIKYTNFFIKKYKIKKKHKILEIGCGCGAFLLPFYKKGIKCMGIDYSNNHIKIAKSLMPSAKFYYCEAINLKKIEKNKFDFIFINSIFQYFPNLNYAKKVLLQIFKISNSNTKIFILDIPDKKKFKNWKSSIIKKIGIENYINAYKHSKHLFYQKDWFFNFLKKKKLKVTIKNQNLIKKENSKYRFNIFITYE